MSAEGRTRPPVRYVLFHTPGPQWVGGIVFNMQSGVEKHMEHMSQLLRKGLLVMGGPFLDYSGGMAVLQTTTIEKALEIGRADPAVQSGLLNVAARAWMVPMAGEGLAAKSPPSKGEAS